MSFLAPKHLTCGFDLFDFSILSFHILNWARAGWIALGVYLVHKVRGAVSLLPTKWKAQESNKGTTQIIHFVFCAWKNVVSSMFCGHNANVFVFFVDKKLMAFRITIIHLIAQNVFPLQKRSVTLGTPKPTDLPGKNNNTAGGIPSTWFSDKPGQPQSK